MRSPELARTCAPHPRPPHHAPPTPPTHTPPRPTPPTPPPSPPTRATRRFTCPATAPERSSGTRNVVHLGPSASGQERHGSLASAGAPRASAARRATAAVVIARIRER